MKSITSNPNRFAAWFNEKYPGAYRQITTEDVENMSVCGLIGGYRYYSPPQDGEPIRGILQYEQLREKRPAEEASEDNKEPPSCKMCGQPLTPKHEGKSGRPKEYCSNCESSRNTERYRRWRKKRLRNKSPSGVA